jgi:hypothetical protein
VTHAAEHPTPPAGADRQPLPTTLADSVDRIIAAVFGGWPTPPESPRTPDPAIEEA